MRWAFWRRKQHQGRDLAHPPSIAPAEAAATPADRRRDEDERSGRRAAPAFSGASPTWAPSLEPGEFEDLYPPEALVLGMSGVRSVVVELVRAVLAGDRAHAAEVAARLQQHEADLEMAPMVAVTALGPRLLVAADVDPGRDGRTQALTAAVAQGDTLVERAEERRRAVAPHCPPELLRYVVRDALGVVDLEAPPDELVEAEDADLLMAAAVLLAQGCADGQGDPTALDLELAQLLPDA